MLEPQTLRFLAQLQHNNNKPWFDANRAAYEAARIDFQNFIQLVIDDLARTDASIAGIAARDCLFRINRDVRFSKDKSPYKANMGASIKRGGKKTAYAGYYFHLEPGKSFVGGGLWMPEAAQVKAVRQEIDYCWEEFRGLVEAPTFKSTFGDLYRSPETSLSTVPKGYDRNHPAIDYLKFKSFIAETPVADAELSSAGLHRKTVAAFKTLHPFICFINRTITDL